MKRTRLGLAILTALIFLLAAPTARAEQNVTVYAVTSTNMLISFDHSAPGTITTFNPITGLQPSETIVGIDFRPADGLLYGVGSTSVLYQINPETALATAIGSTFSTLLSGTNFGVDFNPAADRVRIVSDADQSLRIHPDTGAFVAQDSALAYDAADAQNGVNPQVTAVAYTNSRASSPATTLLGIDSALGNMVRIGGPNGTPSPNGGVLTTLGSLGLGTALTNVGFDVGFGTSPESVLALAALIVNGETDPKLYSIDTAGGRATLIGTIGNADIVDIAISPDDITGPEILVNTPSTMRIRVLRSSGVTSQLSCSEACEVTGVLTVTQGVASRLRLSSTTVGTAMVVLDDAGTATLTVTLDTNAATAFASRRGRRVRRVDLTLTITAVDEDGNTTTTTKSIRASK